MREGKDRWVLDPGTQVFGPREGDAITLERGRADRLGRLGVYLGRIADMVDAAEAEALVADRFPGRLGGHADARERDDIVVAERFSEIRDIERAEVALVLDQEHIDLAITLAALMDVVGVLDELNQEPTVIIGWWRSRKANCLKVWRGGRIVSVAVIIAIGVKTD